MPKEAKVYQIGYGRINRLESEYIEGRGNRRLMGTTVDWLMTLKLTP